MENYPAGSKIPRSVIEKASRHVFLCIGPDCCDMTEHAALWELLKSETKTLPVLRTKAACLRICKDGPWLVVYPDGTWYGQVTPEKLRRILREHVIGGQPVPEWIGAQMPCLKNPPA